MLERFCRQFVQIANLAHGRECKTAEVGVEEQRLSVGVGDDAYAGVAKELGQFGLHLHAERGRGDGVDDTPEIAGRSIVGGYTCATCAQVRVIIGAIEDIGDAGRFTN